MSRVRLLTALFLSTLLACSDGGPVEPDPQAPALPSTSLGESTVGAPFSRSLAASRGAAPLSYSVQGLPSGIALDSQTGALSGAPTQAGPFDIEASVTDAAGLSDQRRYALLVLEAPTFVTTSLPAATANVTYAVRIEASGGKAPLVYRLSGGAFPPGLSLDASGTLSGSPPAAGSSSFELSVTDAHGAVKRAPFTLEVHPSLPVVVTTEVPSGPASTAYHFTFAAEGGAPPYSWSKVEGALPAGLSLSTSGELSGTPSAGGTFSFTLELRDARGQSVQKAFSLTIIPALALVTSTLPDAYNDSPYAHILTATGGTPPYQWTLVSGSLPEGIGLPASGRIIGSPTTPGISPFTVRVTDAGSLSDTRTLTLTVYAPTALSDVPPQAAYVSDVIHLALIVTGGKPPLSFSSSGALPPGLSLDTSSGLLEGTLTSPGSFSFDVTAADANRRTSTRSVSFTVHTPPAITTTTLPEAVQGQPYSHTLTVSGGKPSHTFSLESGSPPIGITLEEDGTLTGTPSGSTSASFTVRVSDANGRSDARSFTLSIYAPPRITTPSLPNATRNTPYFETLSYSGNRGPFTWGSSGTLPPGLSFGSDGSILGTPTTAGTWSFTATFQDSVGGLDSRVFTLVVDPSGSSGSTPFKVGHWNIEWFGSDTQGPPRSTSPGGSLDDLQIANARALIDDADVNLWGLVEVVDTADFQALKAQLPGYDGFLSDDPRVNLGSSYYLPSEQKLGVLYDGRLSFQSATLILTESAADFAGRPPLRVDFVTHIHGVNTSLTVIVVHMKAFDDSASYGRRQRAGAALKAYLDGSVPFHRVLVVGDWNDDVDVSISDDPNGNPLPSPYENFLADPGDYSFITRPLSLAGESSTIGFPDMIDHTLASNEAAADYMPGSAHVLRPTWIADYGGTTSDHYPVLSQYDFGAAPPSLTLTPTGPAGGTSVDGSAF